MAPREYHRLVRRYGLPRGAQVVDLVRVGRYGIAVYDATGRHCAWLQLGRCTVYEDRPELCKRYGVDPTMRCRYLHPEEASPDPDTFQERCISQDRLLVKIQERRRY